MRSARVVGRFVKGRCLDQAGELSALASRVVGIWIPYLRWRTGLASVRRAGGIERLLSCRMRQRQNPEGS